MAIHLIGAMLYLGVIDEDTRRIDVPFLSPLQLDDQAIDSMRRDGRVVAPLPPITAIVVLAGSHDKPTFTLSTSVLIPMDPQSHTETFPWNPAKGYVSVNSEIVVSGGVIIDGSVDSIPVRILVDGNPVADLAIPFRIPDEFKR